MRDEVKIPTDAEIKEIIESLELLLSIFRDLLVLNEEGRRQAVIRVSELARLKKYTSGKAEEVV